MFSTHLKRFLLVGSGGLLIDLAVFGVLVHGVGIGLITGRLVAFVCAILFTYTFNSIYTFEKRLEGVRFARYIAVQVLGAAINLGTYTLLIVSGWLVGLPMLALILGAMIATFSNYLLSRVVVFG